LTRDPKPLVFLILSKLCSFLKLSQFVFDWNQEISYKKEFKGDMFDGFI